MQDIDKTKCSSIPNGTEGRLIDKRDNKIYWVGKLKDGLCWMTQNLDYDGGSVAGYSGSDVVSLVVGTSFSDSTLSSKLYYDLEDYVYTNGTVISSCSEQTLVNGLKNCAGWKKVGTQAIIAVPDDTWTKTSDPDFYIGDSYTSADGKMICNKQNNSYIGNVESDYIPCRIYNPEYVLEMHYYAGNYYNWTSATNDTGNSVTIDGASASGSICPMGWSLPLSESKNNTVDGSFYKLLNELSSAQATASPYYFVYSGLADNGSLHYAGSRSDYWSATTRLYTLAYFLEINSNSVNPSYMNSRFVGYSVRCVAR